MAKLLTGEQWEENVLPELKLRLVTYEGWGEKNAFSKFKKEKISRTEFLKRVNKSQVEKI